MSGVPGCVAQCPAGPPHSLWCLSRSGSQLPRCRCCPSSPLTTPTPLPLLRWCCVLLHYCLPPIHTYWRPSCVERVCVRRPRLAGRHHHHLDQWFLRPRASLRPIRIHTAMECKEVWSCGRPELYTSRKFIAIDLRVPQ